MVFLKKWFKNLKRLWRWYFVFFVFVFTFLYLIFYLYEVQVENNYYYLKKALARDSFKESDFLKRGNIFFTDKNNDYKLVATNKEFSLIYAVPKEIEDVDGFLNSLKELNIFSFFEDEKKLAEIKSRLSNKNSLFLALKEKSLLEEVEKIKKLNLKGLYIVDRYHRYYPFSNLASHLIGFAGFTENSDSAIGLYGIEKYYQEDLFKSKDLNLTIDLVLQKQSELILEKLIKKFDAQSGGIIIQEPNTGKILAMTFKPDFDLNNYSKYKVELYLNPLIQLVYEPGSVIKVITMAIGLETGKITPESVFYDKGYVVLNNKRIENWDKKAYGEIKMSKIIERSINTGAVFVESKIGHKLFYEYLKKFGFDEKTNIDLPYEVKGNLSNLNKKHKQDIEFANASFGQGIAVSPIALINSFSAIANGGVLMRPYLNNNLKPEVVRRVISKKTSEEIIKMMENAVEQAKVATILYYRIAGKTGTAQVPDLIKGGYKDEYIHTFIGFGPVSAPKFVILIKLDKPKAELAGLTVVPAFKELATFVLNYYNIAPDKLNLELKE